MVDIQKLINKGSTEAAFKYKANAEKFMNAWEKKGYHTSWLRSSGPVVDANEYVPNAYYCIAEKEAPKPLTAKEKRKIARYEEMERIQKEDPVYYFNKFVKPAMLKKGTIDPLILDLVLELNDNKQFTTSSCSGHGNKRGHLFISKRTFNGNLVRSLFKKYGLTGITRDEQDYVNNYGERFAVYEFDPIKRRV